MELDLRKDGASKCANGDTFCFEPYPSEKIQSILEKTSFYRRFWCKDEELDVDERNEDEDTFVCAGLPSGQTDLVQNTFNSYHF